MKPLQLLAVLFCAALVQQAKCEDSDDHEVEILNGTSNNSAGKDVPDPAKSTTQKTETESRSVEIQNSNVTQATLPKKIPNVAHQMEVRVTSDICNLSLAIPSENKEVKMVRCRCDVLDVDVDCSYLELTELPPLISFPKTAKFAQFTGNKISNIKNDTFYNGRSLHELDLSYNRIDFISVVAFQSFKNLRRLDLSHNRLWTLHANSFQGLSQLEFLNLGYNDMSDFFSDIFVSLTNLKELNFESNPVHELPPKLFEHLAKLEALNMQSLLLRLLPDHIFVFTPNLKVLYLTSNQLMEVPTEALTSLKHIKILDLSGNPVRVIREEAFRGLRNLVVLYLDNMPILKTVEKYAFGDLQLLQELHCSYNFFLTEFNPLAFVRKVDNKKAHPSQVFLRQNSLTTLSKDTLDWSEDVELHIQDNPLSCDCKLNWMIHLKLKNDFQSRAMCVTPMYLSDMTLKKLKDHELSCGLDMSEVVLISIATVVAIMILGLIVAFLLWRRSYPQYRKQYLRVSKKRHVNDIDYRGDDAI